MRRQSYTGRRGDLLSLVPDSARNVLDMGCSNGSFGGALKDNRPCAVAADVLEHLVDPWSTVRALADKLSDKGVFYVPVRYFG